jgi:hypothetical protein
MVEAALAPLHIKGGSPCEYPHTTYIRWKKRLDYILISAELVPAIQRTGLLPFHQLWLGDHRACYIEMDASVLFGSSTCAIVSPTLHKL